MKKYEFTGETKTINTLRGEVLLHRIRAKIEFKSAKIGDLGGWIEKEENLADNGDAWVSGDAQVYGNALVCGNAQVYGNALVSGDARVYGNALVCGDAWVCGDARVCKTAHILVIGPAGSRNGFTTFYRDMDNEITVKCGCFLGKIDKFLDKVTQTHGDSKHALVYREAAEAARQQIDLTPDTETPTEEDDDE